MPGPDDDTLIYANHAPQDLPAWCCDLLDPDQALPADVFHIERAYLSNAVVLAVTAIPAGFAVIMTLIDGLHGKLVLKEWLSLFPIFTLPLVWSIVIARRDRRLTREIAARRLRMGLFLTVDALLLRMTPDACSLVPRQWISRFDMTVLDAGRAGSGSTYRMRVIYRLADGGKTRERTLSFDCPNLSGYFMEHAALLQLLQKWRADGIVPRSTPAGVAAPRANPGQRRPGPLTPDDISKARKAAWQAEEKIRLEQKQKAEAARPKPGKRSPAFLPSGKLKTHWEHHTADGHNYFCQLNASGEVAAWENWRDYIHSEMGGSVSFDEFLAGEYQHMLQSQFGMGMLEEVIAAVEYLKADPDRLSGIDR